MRKVATVGLFLWVVTPLLLAAAPAVNAHRDGTNLVIHFTGRLQGSSHVQGPYTNVAGASSPHMAPLSGTSNAFWRAVLNGVRTIAAGSSHSAAVKIDGTLWAWGSNSVGQLGIGTDPRKDYPVQVGTNDNWLSVALGHDHTVALRTDGTLWTWGNNASGQLGIGTTNNTNTPVQVGTDANWESISAGTAHTLATRTDGTLWAWGDNGYGQLGIGGTNNTAHPVQVGVDANWQSVSAGGLHSFALREDGTLWGWGSNESGQLGTASATSALQPVQVGANTHWRSPAAGGLHTAAIDTEGFMWAWGANNWGQLGIQEDSRNWTYSTNRPMRTIGSDRWRAISLGSAHTMALSVDGTLWACGSPARGQLGVGTTVTEYEDRYVPITGNRRLIQVGTDANWSAVAAGESHTLALRTDGTLWAWGEDRSGQLGNATNRYSSEQPLQIGVDPGWQSLSAGGSHAVALRKDGTLWAWGWNERGQLGTGNFFDRDEPTHIGTNADWRMVSAGDTHTAAIRTDGTLWTWGWNNFGVLGTGTDVTTNVPVQVGTAANWRFVSAGGFYYSWSVTAAIREDGTLWAWGNNGAGQLGDGSFTNASTPVQVGSDTDWRFVSVGTRHTVAIRTDGTLWAWGRNALGSLGIGESVQFVTNRPAQVGIDANWRTVGAGDLHTVAVRTDGTLWAWGWTPGTNPYISTNRPVQIALDADWLTVSVRGSSTLALRANRTLWQLTSAGPVQVGGDSDWESVAAGYQSVIGRPFAVGLRADGTLWAWGNNSLGQLAQPRPWLPHPVPGSEWWTPTQ